MGDPKQAEEQKDDLELEVEEVVDLDLPESLGDEVRGASGIHGGQVAGDIGRENC